MSTSNENENQFLRPDQFWIDVGLRANQTIAHLGCGAGYFLTPAAKIVGLKGKVYGVDIRADMLQEVSSQAARNGLADIVVPIRADLENGPVKGIKNDCSDWTLMVNIISHADPDQVLGEAKRITKPGGTIVIVEWSLSQAVIGPPVEQRAPKEQVLEVIARLDLKLSKEFTPSPYHYGLYITVPN